MLTQGLFLFVALLAVSTVSESRKLRDVTLAPPASFDGDFLIFGWSEGMNPIEDYPSYTGKATIYHDGKVWKMVQHRGQKVVGGGKEESSSVGTEGDGFLSFGWAGGSETNDLIGSSEYFMADDNTLIGPWTQLHSGGVGFEELVRFDASKGYYVDLHTDYQKNMRQDILSKHVAASGASERFFVEDWVHGKDGDEGPSFIGTAVAKPEGVTVEMISDFLGMKDGREFVGLIDDHSRVSMGWRSVDGKWGSAKFDWSNGALEGSWTTFGSDEVGFQRMEPIL